MAVRLATEKDIDVIVRLRMQMLREEAECLPENLEDAVFKYVKDHLPNGSCICALLEEDGQVVSMAMLCAFEEIPDEVNVYGKTAKLRSVYTVPEYRGRGYMEKLLLFLLEAARENNIKLITNAAERKAIPLYKRVGFQMAETMMFMDL